MILGVGIDSVNIDRFNSYEHKDHDMLLKLFTQAEIAYCLSKPKPATHFASHFAIREAFFKAHQALLAHYNEQHSATLLTINKQIELLHTQRGLPYIQANWSALIPAHLNVPQINVSITHTDTVTTAVVLLS